MITWIDNLLNRITMYRLVLYVLIGLLAAAVILGTLGILSYSPVGMIYNIAWLLAAAWISNKILGWFFRVPVNVESSLITALILALIITPPSAGQYIAIIPFLVLAGVTAMASKYVVNIGKKHLFNPAAFAVVLTAWIVGQSASWWVGTTPMLICLLIAALLMWRKLRQFDLAIAFIAASLIGTAGLTLGHGDIATNVWRTITASPLIFFGGIMLTEPLTMPPNRHGRILYGILVGLLIIPQAKFGSYYLTPEIALLIGNLFAYAISPKGRHVFTLRKIERAGSAAYDFVFQSDRKFAYLPGQYMEWTLGHSRTDSRGNRRYFTIASSPTEPHTILGVKFYPQPSSFKRALANLKLGQGLVGSQLAGDFVMPKDPKQKLVFIAGGIGITPFRSMAKYLIDTGEKRDIILFYSNRTVGEIAYADVFTEAGQVFGMKTVHTVTDEIPADWDGQRGFITKEMITAEAPDYKERVFYISGSRTMVTAFKKMLLDLGVPRRKIKTDFFPGLA